jgi:hypothetical protein
MDIREFIKKKSLPIPRKPQQPVSPPRPKRRSELDIYFTAQFHTKAAECGLTEEYARLVFYEGEVVMQRGKPTNMKVATIMGEEIGIYVFRDRETDQPVITSIWKRKPRAISREDA